MSTDEPVKVRLGDRADATAVASVLREAFVEYEPLYTPAGYDATTPTRERVLDRMREGPVWIASAGGDVVGTVAAVSKPDGLQVRGMGVVPAARGRRIGERLLHAVERFALERDHARIYLSTTPFLARAIRLYRRYGFRRTEAGPHDLHGTPLFTMEKRLAPDP